MRVKSLFLSFCLLLILSLTACSGYNNIMYKHLSNENNYETYEVAVVDFNFSASTSTYSFFLPIIEGQAKESS